MQKLGYIIFILSLLCVAIYAQSYTHTVVLAQPLTGSSASSLLQHYNVPNSIISNLKYTAINYSKNTYIIAYNGTQPSFLINTTKGSYSIVLNSTQIAAIIGPSIIASSLQQINATYLNKAMQAYNQSSAGSLTQCIQSTGLDRATCTYANNCQSCTQVPVCGGVPHGQFQSAFYATGGIYGILAYGIMQLETQYGQLESNFTDYFSNVTTLSSANAGTNMPNIESSFANISTITNYIYQNPLFPPPAQATYAGCSGSGALTGNVPSQNGPWYCSSLGYCEFLTYNYTLLGNIQTYLNQVQSLPITQLQVSQVALNITNNENVYVVPILGQQQQAIAGNIQNTTLKGYNSIVTGTASLLSHISNTMLQTDLATIQANYSQLTTNYVSTNLTALNKTLAKQYATLKLAYADLNATYSLAANLASNNTVSLVELQLGNKNPSAKLTALSFQQAELNSQLGTSIKNISSLTRQLQSVSTQAKSISNNPSLTQGLARAINAPIAKFLLSKFTTSYSTGLMLAPLVSLLPVLVVGIILIAAILVFRSNLTRKNKLAANTKTRRNWTMLLIAVGVVVLVFLIATYVVASGANTSAPISAFLGSVHSSKTVIVAINGTNNTAMVACANKAAASLKAINKTTKIITISGIACNNGMPLETVDKCLAYYAANNQPVIIFTNSSQDTISAYSYYGSIMNVNGDQKFMSTCIASTMIR